MPSEAFISQLRWAVESWRNFSTSGIGPWNQRSYLFQSELWSRRARPDRKRRQERHFHVFLLVAGGPGFCDFPGPHSGKIHHRQQQSGGNQKRSPLFKNQYSNDSPHGNPGDLKKYSPGHAPAGNAPFLQLSGADRKGDFSPSWLVPAFGYLAVCICEPVTWVICCVVIAVAVFAIRGEFMDRHI